MSRFLRNLLLVLILAAVAAVGLILLLSPDPKYSLMSWYYGDRFWRYDQEIREVAAKHGIDPLLVKAVIWRESRFHPDKVGGAGERGLMQVTEAAAQDWAKAEKVELFVPTDLFDPRVNITVGTWYLSKAMERYRDRENPVPFALAEYNAGNRASIAGSRRARWAMRPPPATCWLPWITRRPRSTSATSRSGTRSTRPGRNGRCHDRPSQRRTRVAVRESRGTFSALPVYVSATSRRHLLALLLAWVPFSSHGVVVDGGDGTQNTTAPANDFGFGNVGQCFSVTDGFYESCVFLESHWVITAYHTIRDATGTGFSLGQVIFRDPATGAVAFQPVPGSAVRLRNADNSFTDLAVFQITAVPTFLAPAVIASQTPAVGSSLILAGNGINRQPDLTQWDVNTATTPDTWTEVPSGGDEQGYELIAAPSSVRWGTNTLENNATLPLQTRPTVNINAGYGTVTAIRTDFDRTSGEAQGVAGDSGGGVFYQRNGIWELAGVMVTRDYKDGQTTLGVDTAVFGNSTYAANLPTYREQIVNTIPEPSAAGMLIFGATSLFMRRRR